MQAHPGGEEPPAALTVTRRVSIGGVGKCGRIDERFSPVRIVPLPDFFYIVVSAHRPRPLASAGAPWHFGIVGHSRSTGIGPGSTSRWMRQTCSSPAVTVGGSGLPRQRSSSSHTAHRSPALARSTSLAMTARRSSSVTVSARAVRHRPTAAAWGLPGPPGLPFAKRPRPSRPLNRLMTLASCPYCSSRCSDARPRAWPGGWSGWLGFESVSMGDQSCTI